MPPPRATAACCCDAPTSVLALLQIGLGTHRAAEMSADGTASAPATGGLADQMSSPGDYLPVRVGPAFGIAPCVELWAKEFGGGWRVAPNTPIYTKYVRVAKGVQNGFLHPQTAQKNRCALLLRLMSALDSTDS